MRWTEDLHRLVHLWDGDVDSEGVGFYFPRLFRHRMLLRDHVSRNHALLRDTQLAVQQKLSPWDTFVNDLLGNEEDSVEPTNWVSITLFTIICHRDEVCFWQRVYQEMHHDELQQLREWANRAELKWPVYEGGYDTDLELPDVKRWPSWTQGS